MTTISVPLNAHLEKSIDTLVSQGVADNKASFVRKAIESFIEQTAIRDILEAEKELKEKIYLKGNIKDLAKKIHG